MDGGRVLAIRSGALGDTIVALPAIAALGRSGAHVELLGRAPYVELVEGSGLARKAHSIDRVLFRGLFGVSDADAELDEFLGRFDRVISWSKLPRLAGKLEELGVELTESTPLPPDGVHASDHLYAALEPLGVSGPAPPPKIEVQERPHGFPPKFAALHPSSGSPGKNWPPEHFETLARLVRASGLDLVWIQGEADGNVVPDLVQKVPGPVACELPLRELAAVLASSAIYVGNDSGVSHLAAAVGAPTVAVFCTTDPAQWAPRGPRVCVTDGGASPEALWGFASNLINAR